MTALGSCLALLGGALVLIGTWRWWLVKLALARHGFPVSWWRHDRDVRILAREQSLDAGESRSLKRRLELSVFAMLLGYAFMLLGLSIVASRTG